MLGKRYLLDTNALVALLQGHQGLLAVIHDAQWLGVSVINILEFLGFDGLSDADRELLSALVARVQVVDLVHSNSVLMGHITDLRKLKSLKLPDAIVAASAALHNATLLTNDVQLLKLAADDNRYNAEAF